MLWDSDVNNNFVIKDRNTFFKDYKILNWEDKVDYNKGIIQTPLSFEDRFIAMNYTSGDTYYETYYHNKFDSSYGELKLNTGYEFNNNTKELIKDTLFMNTVMSNEKTKMLINNTYVYKQDEKILPALFKLEDNMRNQSDSKYNLLFNNGMKSIQDSIIISDDSVEMFAESENGCWIDRSSSLAMGFALSMNLYPQHSTLYNNGELSWDLGYPRESYSAITRQNYPESATIYNNFWAAYFNDIYNIDSKIIKCYVHLTPIDILNFSFKNFVAIGNCIWHVNKIIDYNPLSDETTQVELIKVMDIASYTSGQKRFS